MIQNTSVETCQNCGTVIGKLEIPRVYRDQVVCEQCWLRLAVPVPAVPLPVFPPTPTLPASPCKPPPTFAETLDALGKSVTSCGCVLFIIGAAIVLILGLTLFAL